jgi:translation initiation factor 1
MPLNDDGLHDFAKQLKQKFGTGGTIKEGVIEIQGDHLDAIMAELEKRNYRVKRVGG